MMKPHLRYNQEGVIVAIDGPASAGKSTIAKALALDLNYLYVDTGAMYRAVAYACNLKKIDATNENELNELLKNTQIEFVEVERERKVFLNDEDVSNKIRDPALHKILSIISAQPIVRNFLIEKQRSFSQRYSMVMEGRDIGTVVFPNAHYKFFLTASPEVRAKRRFLEYKHKGIIQDEPTILKEILERDYQDTHRKVAPLRKAADAIEIDTSSLNAEASVQEMLGHIFKKSNSENLIS